MKLQACNFIKKETLAQVFSCEFGEITKNAFSYRTPLMAASVHYKKSLPSDKTLTYFQVHECQQVC